MKNSLLLTVSILFFASCQKQQYAFVPASKVEHFQSVDGLIAIDEKLPIKDTIIDIHDTTAVPAIVIANDLKKSNQLRRAILKKQLAEKRKEEQIFANKHRDPEARKIHRSAVKSLVIGISSIAIPVVPLLVAQMVIPTSLIIAVVLMGIVAILMGLDAFKRNKAMPTPNRTDKKIALSGIITGLVGCFLPIVVYLFILFLELFFKAIFGI
jgi:uncharacterized membrane protein